MTAFEHTCSCFRIYLVESNMVARLADNYPLIRNLMSANTGEALLDTAIVSAQNQNGDYWIKFIYQIDIVLNNVVYFILYFESKLSNFITVLNIRLNLFMY